MKFYSFDQMAGSEEEWECPSCHNLTFAHDDERALIALGFGKHVHLECRCGAKATGDAVKLRESASYRFSED